jgi:uncharacterized protein YbjT (DUF2867 family)
MQRVLVVGATGQLGAAVISLLLASNCPARGLVRTGEAARKLASMGVEAVLGDLTDPTSLELCCEGIDTIIATATATIPSRKSDTVHAVDDVGYKNQIAAAVHQGVRRFVFVSVPLAGSASPQAAVFACKRRTENLLLASGMEVVILRTDAFMDAQFAFMGSDIPLRGSDSATVLRPFASRVFNPRRKSIQEKHIALITGSGQSRHAFIALEDVAKYCVSATRSQFSGVFDLGGPEALSFLDVVQLYERLLGIELTIRRTPAALIRFGGIVLKPFNPAVAELMRLTYSITIDESVPHPETAAAFGIRCQTAEQFLSAKLAI